MGHKHRQTMRRGHAHTHSISLRAQTQKLRSPSTPPQNHARGAAADLNQALPRLWQLHTPRPARTSWRTEDAHTPIGFIGRESLLSLYLSSRFSASLSNVPPTTPPTCHTTSSRIRCRSQQSYLRPWQASAPFQPMAALVLQLHQRSPEVAWLPQPAPSSFGLSRLKVLGP